MSYEHITIVFVMPLYAGANGEAGGVYNELLQRKRLAELAGFKTELFDLWKPLGSYNPRATIFHVFMANNATMDFVQVLHNRGYCLCVSPILDTTWSPYLVKGFVELLKPFRVLHSHLKSASIMARLASGLVVRSEQERSMAERGLGCAVGKIDIVLCAPRTLHSPGESVASSQRVLFVGDWGSMRKNVYRLVLAAELIGVPLTICGKPTAGPIADKIAYRVANSKWVEVKGFVSSKELADLYRSHSVVAAPSLFEGIGLSALEALFCGAKIVISDRGGVRDYFKHNSVFVNPMSTHSIAEGLRLAITMPKQDLPPAFFDLFSEDKLAADLTRSYLRCLHGEVQ